MANEFTWSRRRTRFSTGRSRHYADHKIWARFMQALCDTFRTLSYKTWDLLGKGRSVHCQMGEETITDLNLLELIVRHTKQVVTHIFTKPAEAATGADWEWWFTGGGKWVGFRAQAKILELRTETFSNLHYKTSKGYQADILISSALSGTPPRIPIYCLYLHWCPQSDALPWPCGSFTSTPESFGVSLCRPSRCLNTEQRKARYRFRI